MKTEVYATKEEFNKRTDKTINGISQDYLSFLIRLEHTDFDIELDKFAEQNKTNTGCWNCIGCVDCHNCENVIGRKGFSNIKWNE